MGHPATWRCFSCSLDWQTVRKTIWRSAIQWTNWPSLDSAGERRCHGPGSISLASIPFYNRQPGWALFRRLTSSQHKHQLPRPILLPLATRSLQHRFPRLPTISWAPTPFQASSHPRLLGSHLSRSIHSNQYPKSNDAKATRARNEPDVTIPFPVELHQNNLAETNTPAWKSRSNQR